MWIVVIISQNHKNTLPSSTVCIAGTWARAWVYTHDHGNSNTTALISFYFTAWYDYCKHYISFELKFLIIMLRQLLWNLQPYHSRVVVQINKYFHSIREYHCQYILTFSPFSKLCYQLPKYPIHFNKCHLCQHDKHVLHITLNIVPIAHFSYSQK